MTMDHQYIDAESIAERYVAGKLEPDEEARFEKHYLVCSACVDRVEEAQRLRRGLARVAQQEAAGAVRVGILAKVLGWSRSRQAGWVLALALLAAALPASLGYREAGRLRSELETAQKALATAREAPSGEEDLTALRQELELERAGRQEDEARWSRELDATRKEREDLSYRLEAERRLGAEPSVFPLSAFRSGDSSAVNRITSPPPPKRILLWLEPPPPSYPRYRATLRREAGETVWEAGALELNALGALALSFPAGFLGDGEYHLSLEGIPTEGEAVLLNRYPIRVSSR